MCSPWNLHVVKLKIVTILSNRWSYNSVRGPYHISSDKDNSSKQTFLSGALFISFMHTIYNFSIQAKNFEK